MRLLTAMDWAQYFEDVAVVDEVLRAGSSFASMDFDTRDLYRHAIEELSRHSDVSEEEVARRVLRLAQNVRLESSDASPLEIERWSDPGYYLISKGRFRFEKELKSPNFHSTAADADLLRLVHAVLSGILSHCDGSAPGDPAPCRPFRRDGYDGINRFCFAGPGSGFRSGGHLRESLCC